MRREVAGEEGLNQCCPALMESQYTCTPCALGTRASGMLGSAAGLGEGKLLGVAP